MIDPKLFDHELPNLENLEPSQDWFDNSSLDAFQRCERKAWYTNSLRLEDASPAMSAGSVLHAGLAEYHLFAGQDHLKARQAADFALGKSYQEHASILTQGAARYQFTHLNKVMDDYMHNYGKDKNLVHVVSEIPFAVWVSGVCGSRGPFCSCSSDSLHRCFWLVGRFDGVVEFMNELYVLENKTTRSMSSSYLRGLEISRQPSTYTFAVRKILKDKGFDAMKIRGVLFNIIAFGEASTKFHRFPVLRSEKYLTEYEDETRRIVANMRGAFSNSQVKPLKRTTECTTYGLCPFISLCDAWQGNSRTSVPQLISTFKKRTWRPF